MNSEIIFHDAPYQFLLKTTLHVSNFYFLFTAFSTYMLDLGSTCNQSNTFVVINMKYH